MDSKMIVVPISALRRFAGWLAVGLSATVLALPAFADAEPVTQHGTAFAAGRSVLAKANCDQARDLRRCLAMQQARALCQDEQGIARRRCLREKMPAPDCGKAPDPRRCLARQQARLACQGRPGKELRQCLRQAAATPPISNIN